MKQILIRDRHAIMVSGIRQILELFTEGASVKIENDDEQFLALLGDSAIDFVITEFYPPELSALEFIRKIQVISPHTTILVISQFPAASVGALCIEAGAKGYLEKSSNLEAYKQAIATVLAGEVYLKNDKTGD